MSETTHPSDDDPQLTAAEYAMGLLTGPEALAFERLMEESPELRGAVLVWAERLAQLADEEVAPVTPPRRLARALEQRLFGGGATRQRLGFWLASGIGAGTLAFAAVFSLQFLFGPGAPEYQALLDNPGEALTVSAEYQQELGQIFVSLQSGGARPGRALQLWAIAGEEAPVSLGLIDAATGQRFALGPELEAQLPDGVVLAISDEPSGGSPTGQPTGEVLAAQPLVAA